MFRKLRFKLTLMNVAVVSLISMFFLAGIYILMLRSMSRQSDQLMQLIATDAGSSTPKQFARHDRHQFNYFYVKVDNSGKITETSQELPVSPDQLQHLTAKTLALPVVRGRVSLHEDEQDYRFLKAPLRNGQGKTLIFLNTEWEDEVIDHLFAALTITGLGGIALTLFGSLFMAYRALIPIKISWEKQRDFIADASHELRTPLAVIQTNLDIVKSNPNQTVESQITWLDNIQAESSLMAKLVDDLLFLARADSDQQFMIMDFFPLSLALEEAIRPFQPVAAQKGINLRGLIQPDIDFHGDRTRLKQLVTILIDNAIKYTPPGGEVTLKLEPSLNGVEITVTDTGEGIDKKHLSKIFERFYRVDKARSRQSGGTGLGLAIAEWIVKGHHGNIKVSSLQEKGTTFSVFLPRRK